MKKFLFYLKEQKIIFLFLFIIFIFGMISGILFYLRQESIVKENILTSLNNLFISPVFSLNNIFIHILILLSIFLITFLLLGIPLFVIYIFLEGVSTGFIIPIFISLYKINGIFYFLLYFVLIKSIFLILISILFLKLLKFSKKLFESFKYRKNLFSLEIKYVLILILFVLINDLIIYFGSNQVLSILLSPK